MPGIGHKVWAVPDGYIPSWSHGPEPDMVSHEAVCILNTGDEDAHLELTVYFSDREPVGPYRIVAPARRTIHLRLNDLQEPEPIPVGKEYALVVRSDVPVVVQHSRLDTRQAENTLMTTMAFPVSE
ncbi:protein of unknown function DUF1362 [Thermobaculum terrenum ATCC BAA-798]|uniref:Sensory rhodopsin transducer n=1 Tax=Thermobaculum terrenum (strain ATCC BAA-798 / CCMEE 7001 / YNP1) TaxID=525904 RepID=D1CHI6_THET1|nr:sensory rhodopsin transducer [Thermobaculum terrenum]ACZ43207.1 protein of unknown function DUF1362 [Thermobaculum terrenum ATCC BAA-798]